jgi:hypothetical protein
MLDGGQVLAKRFAQHANANEDTGLVPPTGDKSLGRASRRIVE